MFRIQSICMLHTYFKWMSYKLPVYFLKNNKLIYFCLKTKLIRIFGLGTKQWSIFFFLRVVKMKLGAWYLCHLLILLSERGQAGIHGGEKITSYHCPPLSCKWWFSKILKISKYPKVAVKTTWHLICRHFP